ncbi:MAG: DNA repair protein RecO [Verrucomicrobiota bacterium]
MATPPDVCHDRGIEKATGILIRKTPLTETSLIVHWCTAEHGIIRTVARGARRPASPFAGKLDLFYSAELEWVPAKRSDLHTLREVMVTDFRHGLQATWPRVLCASYFVKLLEATAEAETPVESLHDLLRRALDFLTAKDPTRKAVLHFERELARDLGIHGEPGVSPIAALRPMISRIPDQREELLKALPLA